MWKNVSVNFISRRRVSKRFQGISFSRIISFIPVNITKQDFSNAFRNIISAKYSIPKITKSRNVIHTKIYPLKENWLNFFRAVHNNDSTIMMMEFITSMSNTLQWLLLFKKLPLFQKLRVFCREFSGTNYNSLRLKTLGVYSQSGSWNLYC